MAPFIILIALFVVFSVLGFFRIPVAFGWWTALRLALAGMFFLTASAHWGKRRLDLIRMVPPRFAHPDFLVTATGIIELLGALLLLFPATARWSALGLSILLLAVFPANVHAARERLTIAGRPVPGLGLRTVLQIVFLAATLAVVLGRG